MLRAELLDGTTVAFAGGADHVADACERLGARRRMVDAPLLDEVAVAESVASLGAVSALVCDAATPFAAVGGGVAGLRAGMDGAWNATRAIVNSGWRETDSAGGKVVLLGPRPRDGAHAGALGAALENTARTLSIEWARHGIRTTAIRPGDATPDAEIAELVAYLVSPAGDYFSGCAFTLR
jgi:NAD(P)-dependent dehydrogenase (short-subunit alcohol dehydrogenase family)